MKFKIPKTIRVRNQTIIVKQDNKIGGASFNLSAGYIKLGTRDLKVCPEVILTSLIHEISEIIHTLNATRYWDPSVENNFKFILDHKEFEIHNECLVDILANQIFTNIK